MSNNTPPANLPSAKQMLYEILGHKPKLSPSQILSELEAIIRLMPARDYMGHDDPNTLEWVGRASAIFEVWCDFTGKSSLGIPWRSAVDNLNKPSHIVLGNPSVTIQKLLYQAQHYLRLDVVGPVNAAIGAGQVFEYYDELRKVISEASSDILFIDPYMNSDFIGRYLHHVKTGVTIRLLSSSNPKNARYLADLKIAAELFAKQEGAFVEMRAGSELHDRWVFIDRRRGFQSGASFKDGAAKAGTTITENVDAFATLSAHYEELWLTAR